MSYQPYPRRHYPEPGNFARHITFQNHLEEEAFTGIKMNPDGTALQTPKPPTLEQVLAAGYEQAVAERIVVEEQRKFDRGEKPYGPNEPTPYTGSVVEPAGTQHLGSPYANFAETPGATPAVSLPEPTLPLAATTDPVPLDSFEPTDEPAEAPAQQTSAASAPKKRRG